LQNSPIRLANFELDGFEIPETLRFGGRQRLAVHALAGGARVVERLGPDDDEIQFKGTFSGSTAEVKARAFDSLRSSGEIVWLTWNSFRRQVIVRRFSADYSSPWWIHYEIGCISVRQDYAASGNVASTAANLAADFASAIALVAGTGISLSTLQNVLFTANALTIRTSDQNLAATEVSNTVQAIDQQIDGQSSILMTPVPTNSNPEDLSRVYASRVACAGSLAAASNLRGYVGRLGVSLQGQDD
jgi:hypothetical protein